MIYPTKPSNSSSALAKMTATYIPRSQRPLSPKEKLHLENDRLNNPCTLEISLLRRFRFPSELRRLVIDYTYAELNNTSIREAVKEIFSDSTTIIKYGLISYWDTSKVTCMKSLFKSNTTFNEKISRWDVSNVRDMTKMFESALRFNQPLDNWDVSNVYSMKRMFSFAASFNQPLNNWNVSNVRNLSYMFTCATSFDRYLESWTVSACAIVDDMFTGAKCHDFYYDDVKPNCLEMYQQLFDDDS